MSTSTVQNFSSWTCSLDLKLSVSLCLAFIFCSCEGKMRCLYRTLHHQFMKFRESIEVFSVAYND